jgi:threonine/homoserine/homoserine lactone efflux protein
LESPLLGTFLTLLPFAISMSATPGPNNLMVTASAANFGFARTVPHMLGIAIGFPVMLLAVGGGLSSAFEAYPILHRVLKLAGVAYLLFLAWKIATTGRPAAGSARDKPLSFLQAALFQWVNVKAWIIAIGAVTTYTSVGGDVLAETLLIAAVFALVSLPSSAVWAVIGLAAGRLLQSDRSLRVFNIAMAILLVASLLPLLDLSALGAAP